MDTLWEYKKIGDVCTVERGGSPRPIDKFITEDENGINWIKIGDTTESMYITKTEQKIIPEGIKKSRYVRPGDFLLSNSMSFGRPYILQIDGCIHDGWLVLRDDSDFFDKRFLYYCLSSKTTYEKFKSMAVGGVVNNLNSEMVRNVLVPVPDRVEQCEIADLLDKLTQIISYRKNEIRLLDTLIKARFIELFEDGQSPIRTVEELCSEIVDCPHTTPKYEGELKNPAIRTSEIKKGYITWDSMRYVSDEEYEERVARLRPKAGDIVYGREGTFGNAAVLPEGYNFCLGQRVMLLRPDYSRCTSEYLLHAVISDDVYRQALEKNNASTVAHVNVKDVKQFRIPLPSFEKQNLFADFVKQINKSKVVVQKALDEAQTLFDSLMQEYFG